MNIQATKLAHRLRNRGLCNKLVSADLGTPGRIRRAPDAEILKIEGIGPKALAEIREALPHVEE
jgi:ERCC4-type nuclease